MNTDFNDMNLNPESNGEAPAPIQPTPPTPTPPICPVWKKCVDDLTDDHLQQVAERRDYRPELCQELRKRNLIGLFQERIAFPIIKYTGEVIGCHHRPFGKEGKWLVTAFTAEQMVMRPLLVNDPFLKPTVAAFESQWDMFAFLDKAGWPEGEVLDIGCVATRGAMNGKLVRHCCLSDARILAFTQNDPDGKKWLRRVAQAAKGEVLNVQIPTDHKDLNDWTRSGATWPVIKAAMDAAEVWKEVQSEVDGQDDEEPESAYEGNTRQVTTKDGRIWVRLPAENRLMSEFASDMGQALAEKEIYNRSGLSFTIDHRNQTFKQMTPDSFRTWVERYAVCFDWEKKKEGPPMRIRKSMTVTDAGTTLASEHFLKRLRQIRKLNQVRLPVLRKSGAIELLPTGYDAESQTFTFETPGLDYPKDMTLDEAKTVLDGLFSEFCFKDDGGLSKAVALSGMLTLYAYGLLPNGALVPCFIILANAEGAGKTLVVKVIVVPILGKFEAGVKPGNEEELRKALLGVVMQGRNCIILDNLKEHLDSPSLEAFLTSTNWTDRILGSNKPFSGEKNTVVFATGNACTVSPDMRRRSLFVTLFMREERAEARQFNCSLDVPYLLEKRGDILSAQWTLINAWNAAGRPPGSKTHSSFPEWTKTIAAIIEHAGYPSPAEIQSVDNSADRDGDDMRKLVNALAPNTLIKKIKFQDLVPFAQEAGAFDALLGGEGEVDRKVRTIFSRILKRYNGRYVGNFIFSIEGEGHNRMYVFKKEGADVSVPPDLQNGGAT
jgi:hypothetical protein